MLGRTNTGGGGSGGLNFQVIGGTTAPSNPKENMIWVNTSTKITSYIFSATQPTGSAGMVWISTGTSSTVEFNALKKNGIQVYPLSAKQYISGAWGDVTAMSYQGGEWVGWITYLYNEGDECTDITGGWSLASSSVEDNHLEKHDSYMLVYGKKASNFGCTGTNDKVLLKETLYVKLDASGVDEKSFFGIKTIRNGGARDDFLSSKAINSSLENEILALPTDGIESGYIIFTASGNTVFKIYRVWME